MPIQKKKTRTKTKTTPGSDLDKLPDDPDVAQLNSMKADLSDRPLVEEDEKPKLNPLPMPKRVGRPPKAAPKPAPEDPDEPEEASDPYRVTAIELIASVGKDVFILAIQLPYDIAAKTRGEHWKLSREEAERAVSIHAEVIAPYIPRSWLKHSPLLNLAVFHLICISARMMIDERIRGKTEEIRFTPAKESPTNDSTPSGTSPSSGPAGTGDSDLSWPNRLGKIVPPEA